MSANTTTPASLQELESTLGVLFIGFLISTVIYGFVSLPPLCHGMEVLNDYDSRPDSPSFVSLIVSLYREGRS